MPADLWVQVPPGWLELAAFEDDDSAQRWLTQLIDRTPDLLDEAGEATLRATYAKVREQVQGIDVASAGALITVLPDDRVTVWQFAIHIVAIPTQHAAGDEINPMRVITAFLDSELAADELGDDQVETFETADGRDGVAIYTTTRVQDGASLRENISHAEPDQLGVVYAAVRLPRLAAEPAPRVALITGVAPSLAERELMAWIVAQLAVTAELRDVDEAPPEGRLDVDARVGHVASEAPT